MFTRPDGLPDTDVAHALGEGWGLDGAELEYAPVGFGSYHWHVRRGGDRWFASADDVRERRRDDAEPPASARRRLTACAGTSPRSVSTSPRSARPHRRSEDTLTAWEGLRHHLDPARWQPRA